MKIVLVSPFHGGSHQAWAEGLREYSRSEISLLTLPDRFWKWRMHGGSVTLARKFNDNGFTPGLILATDMLDLSVFLALTRKKTAVTPAIVYCHENQLTYPMPGNPDGNRSLQLVTQTDQHYPFINLSSMLAADRIVFNSRFHQHDFLESLPGYLRQFPEFRLPGAREEITKKSRVIYPGIEMPAPNQDFSSGKNPSPLILWNQRWEYDKNPGAFFSALVTLKNEGLSFRLAVCGEQFPSRPDEMARGLSLLHSELIHCGYADRDLYWKLLRNADIVLSTAHHEFFGISILEAILNRTFPLLPARLSYPELIPEEFHHACLYSNPYEMITKLKHAVTDITATSEIARNLCLNLGNSFSWPHLIKQYDQLFADVIDSSKTESGRNPG
jgi:glycosyltransferase involved in cell wall biosynthesis